MRLYRTSCILIGFSLFLIAANFLYFYIANAENDLTSISAEPRKLGKLIIDTDAGGDDAGAIFLALAAEKELKKNGLEIIAITCTYGNTNVSNVAINVLKILTIANRTDIPVYIGSDRPLIKNFTQGNYFGEDGFGDFKFDGEILGQIDRSKHASTAMANLAKQYAGNVSILAIGPLTNVAIAATLDPQFVNNVQRFYIMGSSVRGIGNAAPNVEYNFHQDPHGNFIVLDRIREQPAAIFPWETTRSANISLKWRTDVLGIKKSTTMKYLNLIEAKILEGSSWNAADLMLTALTLWPKLITRTLVTNLTPVYDGAAAGSVLVDYADKSGKPRNVEILETFDVEAFKKLLLEIFSRDLE